MRSGSGTGRSRFTASPTIRKSTASTPGAIGRPWSSASAPTAATWRRTIIPDYGVTVWDVERRAVAIDDTGRSSWAAARFSPDSRRIAVAHPEGEVLVYDLATGQPERPWHMPGVRFLAFSPDGSRIAATATWRRRRTAGLSRRRRGRIVRSIPLRSMATVAWSPDGTTLATACDDYKIYLWDAATGVRRATLEGHTNGGLSAGFDPSGTLLASDGWEARLRLWDPVLGRSWLSEPGDVRDRWSLQP